MSKDEVQLTLGTDNVSVTAKGNSATRLAGSLADLISPFSEAAGAVGDHLRMYREKNTLRALAEARELADKLDLDIKPVTPKFLVRWAEAASLEEDESDLTKLWAGLLVSESKRSHPNNILFMRILSEIAPRHIDLLLYLIEATRENFQGIADDNFHPLSAIQSLTSSSNPFSIAYGPNYSPTDILNAALSCQRVGMKIGRVDLARQIDENKETRIDWQDDRLVSFELDRTYDLLKLLGLIDSAAKHLSQESPDSTFKNAFNGGVRYTYLTPLGADFLSACGGNRK